VQTKTRGARIDVDDVGHEVTIVADRLPTIATKPRRAAAGGAPAPALRPPDHRATSPQLLLDLRGQRKQQSSGEISRENAESCLRFKRELENDTIGLKLRHCEPAGPRKARPDDRLREAIQNLSARSSGQWQGFGNYPASPRRPLTNRKSF
jgi:hypothetical protein